jgi:hypothetical protein
MTWQPPQYDPAAHQQRIGGHPYPPQAATAPPPRKKRRVFLWVFLAIQALFIIWIIAGLASASSGPTAAQQAAQYCANGGWQGLFTSQADCDQHYAVALNDAGNAGTAIGVGIIVLTWCVTDFLVGGGYAVYRLARRRS